MPASMGWATKLGIDTANPVTKQFEFLTCGIGKQGTHVESVGARGSRSHIAESVNEGPYSIGGPLVMEPKPADWTLLLPWIMGSTFSASAITIGDTLTDRYVTVDKVAKVYTCAGCRVNTARFSSSAGQPLRLELDVQGKTETPGDAGSFPDIASTLAAAQPYIHHQGVVTIDSTARSIDNLSLTINNNLVLDRFLGSQSRTELPSGDLMVTLEMDNPFTADDIALYDAAVAGVSGTVKYTAGGLSLLFTFANLKAPAQVIQAARQGEIIHRIPFTAYRTTATPLLVITEDVTA